MSNAIANVPVTSKSKSLNIEQAICSQVLERLGTPELLLKIDAGNVGGSNYRVNVWCSVPPQQLIKSTAGMVIQEECLIGSNVISDSFYVKASPEGGIVSSNPPINKRY
jgi:hypothetical protein